MQNLWCSSFHMNCSMHQIFGWIFHLIGVGLQVAIPHLPAMGQDSPSGEGLVGGTSQPISRHVALSGRTCMSAHTHMQCTSRQWRYVACVWHTCPSIMG